MATSTGQPNPSLPYEPVGRWGHISAIVEGRNYMMLGHHGAVTTTAPPPTVVEIFQDEFTNWQPKPTLGQPPPGLVRAACIAIDSYIYLVGGRDEKAYYNTIHCLDTKRLMWREIQASNPSEAPMAKYGPGMVSLSSNVLVIVAGYGRLPDQHRPDAQYTPNPKHEGQGWNNELHCFHVDSSELCNLFAKVHT